MLSSHLLDWLHLSLVAATKTDENDRLNSSLSSSFFVGLSSALFAVPTGLAVLVRSVGQFYVIIEMFYCLSLQDLNGVKE